MSLIGALIILFVCIRFQLVFKHRRLNWRASESRQNLKP